MTEKTNCTKLELVSPKLFSYLNDKKSEFVQVIVKIAKDTEPILNKIGEVFPHYTLHDIDHSIRIINAIGDLLPNYEELSDLEIATIVIAAILHDVGMFASKEEIGYIKEGKLTYGGIKFDKLLELCDNGEDAAVQDLIRKFHGKRSYDFIHYHYTATLTIPSQESISFVDDIAAICLAHTLDFSWISKLPTKKMLGDFKYNPAFCAILLRIGDILDFDSRRTPLFLYRLIRPVGKSNDEWKKHYEITNNNKLEIEQETGLRKIVFYGQCRDPYVHRLILTYFDWINSEIHYAILATSKFEKQYKIKLGFPLENHIQPVGYTISDLKLSIDYVAITELLMGENIYGDKKYGLRELIQNSFDACALRKEIEDGKREAWDDPYIPRISIIIDDNSFIVKDNGIGMSLDVIKRYFLNIGKSYYQSEEFKLHGYGYSPIGKFGIGFLSCFMLSESVKVKTRHTDHKTCYHLDLVKNSEYICMNEIEDITFDGTEIILDYKQLLSIFEKHEVLVSFMKNLLLTEGIEVKFINKNDNVIIPIQSGIKDMDKKTGSEINLSEYMKGIEGYMYVSYNNKIKSNIFDGINVQGTSYIYTLNADTDTYTLEEVNEQKLDPSEYHKDNMIITVTVPIISSAMSEKFDHAMDILGGDLGDVISRLEDDLDFITIFVQRDDFDEISVSDGEALDTSDDIIYNKIGFYDLEELGHYKYCKSIAFVKRHHVMTLDYTYNYNLHYKEAKTGRYWHTLSGNKVYLRNIYVNSYDMDENFLQIHGYKLNDFKVNVVSNEAKVNISRKDFTESNKNMMLYALQKAAYLYIHDNILNDDFEKTLLKRFIDCFYKDNNIYLVPKL